MEQSNNRVFLPNGVSRAALSLFLITKYKHFAKRLVKRSTSDWSSEFTTKQPGQESES